MNDKPGSPRAGFTLVEISVVVLILALMLTTATVRLDSYLPASRAESAARNLLSTIDLARTTAISKGVVYEVEMDLDGKRYRILTPYDRDGNLVRNREERRGLNWVELPSGVFFGTILTLSGGVVQSGTYYLPFDQIGSAEEVYIQIENEAGEGFALTAIVQALTGTSSVKQGREEPSLVTEQDF